MPLEETEAKKRQGQRTDLRTDIIQLIVGSKEQDRVAIAKAGKKLCSPLKKGYF